MSTRFAVLIGISDYSHVGGAGNLRYASADAKRLAHILLTYGQVPAKQVYLLADHLGKEESAFNGREPTRANILEVCKYAFERAAAGDFVLFYFAGHGVEIESRPYLLTSDTKMDIIRDTALDVQSLDTLLAPSKAQFNLKIFDACRSGYGDGRLAVEKMTRGFQQALLKTATGWASISACSTGEVAYEDPDFEHGVFTHFFCEALTDPPPKGSVAVTLETAVDRVKTSMATWCDLKTRRQTPQFKSDIAGILELSFPTPALPHATPAEGAPDPIREFYHRLNQHLDSTSPAVREFRLTDEHEFDRVTDAALSIVTEDWEKFDHPSISATIHDRKPLQHVSPTAWQVWNHEIARLKLNAESVGPPIGIAITLKGAEVALPDVTIVIAAARFKYFYWVWRLLTFDSPIQKEWKPKQPTSSSFQALKPQTATDPVILRRISKDFMTSTLKLYEQWTKELGKYLNDRIKPFQEAGNIME